MLSSGSEKSVRPPNYDGEFAVSDTIGSAEFHVGEAHVLSSMSRDWIRRTTESGRFAGHRWDKTITVQTTTLDAICRNYGYPAFIKIDVEGHEESVFRGLSVPIRLLSFEFAAENIQATLSCLAHLDQIGSYCYNYSMGESMGTRAYPLGKPLRHSDAPLAR